MRHDSGRRREAPASDPIRPGVPVRLSRRVWRLTCTNPGLMTGPGTNTYLVGGDGRWSVIDPGPVDERHTRAVLEATPGGTGHILLTHTHPDHFPGALPLQSATGAVLLGRASPRTRSQDGLFEPDHEVSDGERVMLGPDTTIRVIHTPGHASNHVCYLLEQERLLFTGDHIIQGSTVVIDPPDGDMSAYIGALAALLEQDLETLAPGHGTLIGAPYEAIRALIRHRLRRENKVLGALRGFAPTSLEALVVRAYDDVPPQLHPLAQRSLLAHLLKLQNEGLAAQSDGVWSA